MLVDAGSLFESINFLVRKHRNPHHPQSEVFGLAALDRVYSFASEKDVATTEALEGNGNGKGDTVVAVQDQSPTIQHGAQVEQWDNGIWQVSHGCDAWNTDPQYQQNCVSGQGGEDLECLPTRRSEQVFVVSRV
jgi:hypothetical protein